MLAHLSPVILARSSDRRLCRLVDADDRLPEDVFEKR